VTVEGYGFTFNWVGTHLVNDTSVSSCLEAQLPAELASVVAARRLVSSAASQLGVDGDVAADAALVASELVTNSVLHAGGGVGVAVRLLGRGLRVEVRDSNSHLPVVDAERPEELLANRSMTGRGLAVVAATADRWGADPLPGGGKVTWAEIGTGRRLVASAPAPAFPPPPAPPRLTSQAVGAGVTATKTLARGGRTVHLIGVPVQLLVDSTRHLADLKREMQVMSMDHRSRPMDVDNVVQTGRQVAAEIDPWTSFDRSLIDSAIARGAERVDYALMVPVDAAERIDRIGSWLRRAGSSVVSRYLLTGPPSEAVAAYRVWYKEEVLAQLSGRSPRPCPLEVPKAVS
jgi:anti-sigma regulatory factor (Ser/Thr protein kinase)